jgi:hypothetical protein
MVKGAGTLSLSVELCWWVKKEITAFRHQPLNKQFILLSSTSFSLRRLVYTSEVFRNSS